MNTAAAGRCRRSGCPNSIPSALANEQLCLEHFLDDAFLRTDQTFLSDALAIVKNLEEKASDPQPQDRDRMLELLLKLANLHEYVAHHSIRLDKLA